MFKIIWQQAALLPDSQSVGKFWGLWPVNLEPWGIDW